MAQAGPTPAEAMDLGAGRSQAEGHYAYFGVTDNSEAMGRFAREVQKLLARWPNRRGNRRSLNWQQFNLMLKRFPLPRPRVMVSLWNPGR